MNRRQNDQVMVQAIPSSLGDRCPRDRSRLRQTTCEHMIISTCPTCGYEVKDSSAEQRAGFQAALQAWKKLKR